MTEEDSAAIQEQLQEVLNSPVFRGSPRCCQFLKHVVDLAIAGRFDALKERVIGIELFGRSPSYDTGEDAIVRVTASDVRKRLLQHYGGLDHSVQFRITLPSGSYVPQIVHIASETEAASGEEGVAAVGRASQATTEAAETASANPEESAAIAASQGRWRPAQWQVFAAALIAVNLAWGLAFWIHTRVAHPQSAKIVPWAALFGSNRQTRLITSDPNISVIQGFTGGQLSIADYSRHKFIPNPDALTPEQLHFCTGILNGSEASIVDVPIAARIAQFAQASGKKLVIQASRETTPSDLQGDDNLILLGSSRSNPWVGLFHDQLDFRFEYAQDLANVEIRNAHPRSGELAVYRPSVKGWATGQSYAIIAFLQNPDGNGEVLLLGGENGEGTEAAGKLVGDLPKFSTSLKQCGISPSAPQHFEMLLRLNTLAGGLPNDVDVAACHIL